MIYNNQHRTAGSQGTQSLSLREAESDEATPDNVTPHPPLSWGLLSTLPLLRGTKGGLIQLASLTRKDKGWTAYQVRNDNNEAISVSPPDKGDERGFDFPSPLKRGDKMGVLTVTPLAPLTLRGGLENNRQYP